MKRKYMIYALLVITAVFLAACSSSKSRAEKYAESEVSYDMADMAAPQSAPMPYPTAAPSANASYDSVSEEYTGSPSANQTGLIFIKTANINLNTNNFDITIDNLKNIVSINGGFFESSNLYTNAGDRVPYRRYFAAIRIPAEQYEAARIAVESIGKLISTNETSREVSAEYYDLNGRISTKKAEEARLLALIEQAEDIEQLITLEQRLGQVRTDIEIYESRLRQIDSLSSYSTINLEITEVTDDLTIIESTDFFARIKRGFINSARGTVNVLQSIAVFLAYISVPVVIIAALVAVGVIISKAQNRKRKRNT